MATTTSKLVSTPEYAHSARRRSMVPVSGIMILFSILMFGLALAIPASRAIQEAEMRDRIAGVATTDDDESESASESNDPASLPAIAELASDQEDSEKSENGSSEERPNPIEDVSRSSDRASKLQALSGSSTGQGETGSEEQDRSPKPTHIRIPSVEIDAEIHEVGYEIKEIEGQRVREWDVASYAAGHHKTSARPGEDGNIVVTGHNDWEGEVFRTLEYAEHGQEVIVSTEEGEHRYVIQEIHMRKEVGASLEERLETGRFMADMPDERLTLITCWPYGINDHRVIVVAVPVD